MADPLNDPPTTASAPGKIILFGEHAVVYGEPAIAVPVTQVEARAVVMAAAHGGVLLRAPDLGEDVWLDKAPADHPLAAAVRVLLAAGRERGHTPPTGGLTITVSSTIPIASGLGSGAAIAAALIRALASHLQWADLAADEAVSNLTFEVERIHHGTPSGIDNTVVSFGRPVFFVRAGSEINTRQLPLLETFVPGRPLLLVIGDSGLKAPTRESVGDVRRQWLAEPERFEGYFAACGRITTAARRAIEAGELATIGRLMVENHAVLRQMTVSAAELDHLVETALASGALGAKMSGGGRGGNMIALVEETTRAEVEAALLAAGAKRVLVTEVISPES